MTPDEARRILSSASDEDEPVLLPPEVLRRLTMADLPDGARFEVGTFKEGAVYLDWDGEFYAGEGQIVGEAVHTWTRKYWYSPLGLEQYLDLVRRAVEARQRHRGDVNFAEYDDDGAFIHLRYTVNSGETDLGAAYARVRAIDAEVKEAKVSPLATP